MDELRRKRFTDTLTGPYEHQTFILFLKELLNDVQIVNPDRLIQPYNTFSVAINGYYHIGNFTGKNGSKIALFSVELKNNKNLENARSMQRNFVKNLLEDAGFQGALAAFYTKEEPDKWRLSFVRLDYEFSQGKISKKLTPAKRYSFLVGKGEPCHTAQQQLLPIFDNENENPSLDDLEAAFSVEAVTDDFFNQYKEKYLQLKEVLDRNTSFNAEAESRGFTSEQFAKKLMGQIVFLYFVQKKGWLGVGAFPSVLTPTEYKNAYYSRGQKPKQLMPVVYPLGADGNYYRNDKAILNLSGEDQVELSKIVRGNPWGSGPKNFMRQLFDIAEHRNKNYFDDFLEPLFYTGLNQNRGENAYFVPLNCRIPFLNGGLFEQLDGYDWEHNDFQIPNEIFSNRDTKGEREADGILDIFDRYNFTIAEDEPMEREIAIDPEMLGKVFENLLDVKDRKSKGAFYTPREIVHFMCQETLINFLANKTGIPEDDIRKFILFGEYFCDEDTKKTIFVKGENGAKGHFEYDKQKELEIPETIFSFKKNVNRLKELDKLLDNVKVADLAVGSGAFPLGMLNEIVKARTTITSYIAIEKNSFERGLLYASRSPYRLKRMAIKNSIFACDIEPSATDITKLRLWLSLVIDDQIMDQRDDERGYDTKPRELPNLDCNIICGNSLIDEFRGIPLITENAILKNESKNRQLDLLDSELSVQIQKLIDLQSRLYDEKDHIEKDILKEEIQDIYDKTILEQIKLKGNTELVDEYFKTVNQPSKPFILWQLYFPKVFRDNGGFDIVIGNPPYRLCQPSNTDEYTLNYFKNKFKVASYKIDLFHLFFEKGIELLNNSGVLSFISPNTYLTNKYISPLRKYILDHSFIKAIVNHDKVFNSASVDTATIILSKQRGTDDKIRVLKTENFVFEDVCIKHQSDWENDKDYIFNINKLEDSISFDNCISLGEICRTYFGIQAYDRTSSISESKDNDNFIPIIDGADIEPYIYAVPKLYFNYLPENIKSGGDWNVYKRERVVVRQIGKVPVVGLCHGNILASNTLYSVYPKNDSYNVQFIFACLNSQRIKKYWQAKYSDNKALFPKIKGFQLKELPIPKTPITKQNEIAEAVSNAININLAGEKDQFNSLVEQINSEIDHLYGDMVIEGE